MSRHTIIPFEEFRKKLKPIQNVNVELREKLSRLDRLAVSITERVGTMGFFLIIFTWTVLWIGWNLFAPTPWQFDPFPAFVLWLFISNMIQILLMPLLLVGQNLQGRHSEARAEADFTVNTRAEKEIELILKHLENQGETLSNILGRIEKQPDRQA